MKRARMWCLRAIIVLWLLVLSNSFLQNIPSPISIPSISSIHIPTIPFPSFDSHNGGPKPLLYFTGAGVYVWWQLGVAKYLQENYDRESILRSTIVGASAGSITSATLLANADFDRAPVIAEELANKYQIYQRKSGLGGILGTMLEEWLDQMIPTDIDMSTFKNLHISLTPTRICAPKLVSNFQSRQDLLNAIRASCHIPLFLNGKPFATYRNESVIDGSFWYFVVKDRWVLPFPSGVDSWQYSLDNVIWIDYGDDEAFMKSISGNIVELMTPNRFSEILDMGYNFMKQETERQSIPLKKQSLTQSTFISAKKMVNTIPKEFLKKIPQSVDRFYRPLVSFNSSATLASTFSTRSESHPHQSGKTETPKPDENNKGSEYIETPPEEETTISSWRSKFPKFPSKLRLSI